jgi:uncharacterized repeat protein (TIGR03803 family)
MTKLRSCKLLTLVPAGDQKTGSAGKLSGWQRACAVFMLGVAMPIALPARTFTTLHSFSGTDGANSYTGLVQGTDGSFYGTTIDGGANAGGNIFKISPSGKLTSLYSFCSQSNCTDGQYPVTMLVQGPDGNFYGTTQSGGTNGGFGTVFKITPRGALTTLHSFNGTGDGAAPYGSLALAINGNFYGTANVGGTYGAGNVFKITPSGKLTTLYSFCSQSGCPDGQYPVGPLIQATDGNVYGTTHAGGNNSCTDGCGTVFKITPSGKLTTLHRFDTTDGDYPYGGLVEGAKMFYGTTGGGGADNWGTVFKMTSSGKLTTLHSFNGTDGSNAYALSLATNGDFYGTTSTGGVDVDGTIFKITPGGTLTILHTFDGKDGKNLYGGLVQGTNGMFYGTTYFGGANNDGTVFSLAVGLGPFVETRPTSGKVGASVIILGTNLTGASSVTFDGTPATFKVISKSEIKTTVPDGATSGTVKVTTPSRKLSSNVPFQVTK